METPASVGAAAFGRRYEFPPAAKTWLSSVIVEKFVCGSTIILVFLVVSIAVGIRVLRLRGLLKRRLVFIARVPFGLEVAIYTAVVIGSA